MKNAKRQRNRFGGAFFEFRPVKSRLFPAESFHFSQAVSGYQPQIRRSLGRPDSLQSTNCGPVLRLMNRAHTVIATVAVTLAIFGLEAC